ncbi:MAG: hypothetical protein R3C10_01650 [Pirellulales bacterium]
MAAKLTQEQLDAIHAQPGVPVPVEDEATQRVYYLVDASYLTDVAGQPDTTESARLRELIQAGIESHHVSADDAKRRLREKAQALSQRSP